MAVRSDDPGGLRTRGRAGSRGMGTECMTVVDKPNRRSARGDACSWGDVDVPATAEALDLLPGELALTDLIDLDVLQRIQDSFAAATGVASVITSPKGHPITRPSRFCRLCRDIIRTTERGLANCCRSDEVLGRPNPDGPTVQSCLSCGLWDAGASIYVGRHHLANWLIGQVRNEELDEAGILRYAQEIGADEKDFAAAYREVTVMSTEQFRQVAETFSLLANQLSEQAYQRAMQAALLERSRKAEEQLRLSDERLALVMEATEDAVWDLDLVTHQAYLSPRYWEMLGYDGDEYVHCFETWCQLVHPEDLPVAEAELQRHLDGETPSYRAEFRMRTKNGEWRWIRSRGRVVMRDADGRPRRIVGTHIDISEQRQRVAEETESQVRMQRIQRFESLGVLAGGVAHDFNNYLMCIMGNLELSALELPDDSPAANLIDEAMAAARRSAELCRQMLAYAGRRTMQVAEVDLAHMLRESSSLLRVAGGGRAVVDLVLPPHCPKVRVDAMEVQQVVINLVTNAMEAVSGPEAAVSVSARALDCSREVLDELCFGEGLRPGRYVFIRVVDNGVGMPDDVLDRAFEPFFTTKFQGRGLGLAASLGIARAHGGSISLKSEPGGGTVAQLILPVVPDARGAATEANQGAADRACDQTWHGHGKVLLVDDELAVRDIAGKMLKRAGFEVLTAESGARAIELFRACHHELGGVLLDWAMPGLGGEEVLRELRRINSTVPVVLVSGYSQAELAELLSTQVLAGIVHKPFSYDRLREAMWIAVGGGNLAAPDSGRAAVDSDRTVV